MKACPFCEEPMPDTLMECPHCRRDLVTVDPGKPLAFGAIQVVRIVDVDMPFGSMVAFMVKWSLAAIPALLLLGVIGFVVVALLGGLASLR